MAAGANNAEAERAFSRAQLKLNLNLPSIDTPRSLSDLQSIAHEIQRQKNEVLCHLKHEDKDRHSYFTQLEHLARQMRELPLPTDSPTLEYELERTRLELETQRMQDRMLKTLGPTSEVVRRREERILHLRKLDQKLAEINTLIVNHVGKSEAAASDLCHTTSTSPALPGDWTNDKDIWLSGSSLDLHHEDKNGHSDTASVMSFTSSIHSSHGISGSGGSGGLLSDRAPKPSMGPKVEVVYNLLTMLFSHDRHNVSQKLLHMSTNPETRSTLHQVGCIPLLVQLIYNQDGGGEAASQDRANLANATASSWMLTEADKETRASAAQALHNLVYNSCDDRKVKREIRILKLLELIRSYADRLRDAILHQLHHHDQEIDNRLPLLLDDDMDSHPCAVVTNLMKLSFDDDHRQAMSHLGALQGLSELLHLDQLAHGSLCDDAQCTTLRRYASMTLTNLTFGHGPNKALLCSTRPLLAVLSHQLASPNDDLRQVTASVLRNLSWRADSASKDALQQTNVVQSLITMSMETHRESTLKSMLSALWNLSSHSSCNKATICATPGSLEFLVRTLTYKSESKTLSIVESGGGIVRNISSHIATRDDYRATLRRHGCFQILLHHLRSPSLTVVSNACGTLWNLSARCKEDQSTLRDLGAIPMLRNLVHSRHKMIATASSAALKNLESGGFGSSNGSLSNSGNASSHNTSLQARKQKALEQEIDQTLTEMCDNIDPLSPLEEPAGVSPFDRRMYRSLGGHNTTSLYGRASTAPTLVPKSGSTPIRPIRSSSLERKNAAVDAIAIASGGSGGAGCPRARTPSVSSAAAVGGPPVAMGSRLQATRTVWHSHENEISYTSLNYEEDDQPVNYSLKYTEEVVSVPVATHWTPSRPTKPAVDGDSNTEGSDPILQSGDQMNPSTVKKAMVLSAYRETDLDEPERPTDFSLRYPDEDEDYAADSDTMQTYCMEGTPYETPFTRSSAASLSDLREAGLESPKMEADDAVEKVDGLETKPNCQDNDEEEEAEGDKEVEGKTPPMPRRLQPANKESKTVTFNTTADCEINYSEQQTPLMFSRSSSLESLDSLDQQQNCHDEGSVVSEFSRLTSRAVSPSELPDSPGQTMPSSPRRPQVHHPQQQDQQQHQHQQHQMQQQQQLPKSMQRVQHAEGVFDDTTNNFGMEGTPAFTRAASPLSQLSFDDEPSSPTNPTPPPPPPPPIVTASRTPMPLPSSVPASASSASQLVNPTFNRVIRSASEVNFRSTFDYDEPRRFNEEDSPALTRWTSLSSLHIDGEVISTAKLLPPSHGVGNLDSAHLTERKLEQSVKVEVVSMAAASDPVPIESNEWSEESGSEDDLLLEIITQGKPTSRQPAPQPAKSCKLPATAEATVAPPVFRPHVPKSASVQEFSQPARSSGIPPSHSIDSCLSKGNVRDIGSDVEDDDDDDDDEMLYACIRSAKPTAKPVPPPRTSSISSKSTSSAPPAPPPPPSNGMQKSRSSRPPMELPKSASSSSSKERVPPLHGPFTNVRQMAMRVKSSSEVARSSGRRSRHSSQGSSRMGASGCSNNTSVDLDYRYSYKVEDTPVTFSRNSSLSSLSVNSNDDEPSAEDQALLDSCISWGMPKSKSDYLDGRSDQNKKTKATKCSGAKIPTSQSWSGGVRRAGDGQASASPSTVTVTTSSSFSAFSASASNYAGNAIDPSDVVVKLEEPDPNGTPSMTHSSLIRMEANQVAAQIQSQDSLDGSSQCNDLEHFPSLTSSFIDGAASWTDTTRKSPSLTRKPQQSSQTESNRGRTPVNGANPLLKQALSSGLVIATEQSNMTSSTSTSFRIENTKPPADFMVSKVTDSFASLTCSVLDPSYFDDEQRREGLLTQLAIMEHTVDENANTDSSVSSSPTGERRKLTPRDRRQAEKERYQTYTLNANPVEENMGNGFHPDNSTPQNNCDEARKTAKQRRSSERERFMTQTISSSNTTGSDGETSTGKAETTESTNQKSMSASELSALEMDAKAVIRTLKEEVKLSRQKSNSSELISEDCMLDCETLSLVSNESESERSLSHRAKQMALHQDGLENNEMGDMRKTKIVRPEDQKFLEDPNTVKGIRGRRRVLCPVRVAPINGPNRPAVNSSPPQQQQNQQQSHAAMTTSPAKMGNGTKTTPVSRATQSRGRSASPASPSPVRPNRTSALRQNTTQSQKSKYPSVPVLESQVRLRSNSKSPRVSSAPCSPRQLPAAEQDTQQLKRRSLEMTTRSSAASLKSSPPKSESVPVIDPQHPPLATLGKQGTFTKEKSSSPEGAAAREEEQSVKIPPKVPPKPKIPPAAKPALPKKPSRFNNGPSPLSSPRSKGSPALSRRSVSSASIGSDSTSVTTTWSGMDEQTSSSTPPQKRTPPKKVVTSKIASLWKQVEESRSKQKSEQPDVRKWISRGDNAKPSTEDKSVGTGCSPDQTPRPIVSSGTFEKLSSFSNTQQVPVISPATVNSPFSDKRSPPSRLPFRLPRFGRSSSQSSTPTTPTLPTPPSPSFDISNSSSSAETEDKRKFRVTAL